MVARLFRTGLSYDFPAFVFHLGGDRWRRCSRFELRDAAAIMMITARVTLVQGPRGHFSPSREMVHCREYDTDPSSSC